MGGEDKKVEQEMLDPQDLKEREVTLDQQEKMEHQAGMALQALMAELGNRVMLESLDQLDRLGLLDVKVQVVSQV